MLRGVLTGLLMAFVLSTPARAEVADWRYEHCRFQSLSSESWTYHELHLTLHCAARRWGIAHDTAHYVIDRESNWNPRAYNRGGCGGYGCLGLFQHHGYYWASRVAAANDAMPRWNLSPSAFSGRTNIIVTARMVASGGWGPWT